MTNLPHILRCARAFAIEAHGNQRYGAFPYSVHLDHVADILCRQVGREAAVVGYLHDVLKDTAVDSATIYEVFGSKISQNVDFCTDEPGTSRDDIKRNTYEMCRADMARAQKHPHLWEMPTLGIAAKLADRIANIEHCLQFGPKSKLAMYLSEHDEFRSVYAVPGVCDQLVTMLDETVEWVP